MNDTRERLIQMLNMDLAGLCEAIAIVSYIVYSRMLKRANYGHNHAFGVEVPQLPRSMGPLTGGRCFRAHVRAEPMDSDFSAVPACAQSLEPG